VAEVGESKKKGLGSWERGGECWLGGLDCTYLRGGLVGEPERRKKRKKDCWERRRDGAERL